MRFDYTFPFKFSEFLDIFHFSGIETCKQTVKHLLIKKMSVTEEQRRARLIGTPCTKKHVWQT